ncbi:MAG TPA: peptidoglycan DD-metalloendopeptidase family protein [Firmicutes bacterium]|nr:peptidoglycan DD-metalloendopeptidase family protein [Bacillota bacterium]
MYCKKLGIGTPSGRRPRTVRFMAAAFAALMLLMAPAGLSALPVRAADSLEELYQEQEALRDKKEQLEKEKAEAQGDLDKQEEYLDNLNDQISNTRKMVELYDSRVRELNESIEQLSESVAAKEAEIAAKEAEIAVQYEELQQRLRAISKTGNMSGFQMLLDTESYTDYLIKSKMMETVAENDQRLMDETEAALQEIDAQKEALNAEKTDVSKQLEEAEALKAEADAKKADLDALYAQANKARSELESQIGSYQQDIAQTAEEEEALEAEIQRIIEENSSSSSGSYGGGTMAWPVPTVRAMSSGYGYRWGKLHKGIDIANGPIPVYGENIVAADDGVVIYANASNWWGGGYGYHVIIDHGLDANGNRISTLYAHCSYVGVSVGQTVTKGQTVIGRAGDSGNVTGPHLHFEVRVNGVAVDPIKNGYVQL